VEKENFWGIKCKGCRWMHPTAMYRRGDTHGRFELNELFRYECPSDGESYEYRGKDEELYHFSDSSGE
jgi:hypothetical protein